MMPSLRQIGRTAVRPYICGGLLLILGTFLRFHALDRQSLWDDETFSLAMIQTPPAQALHRFEVFEFHPPLYFLQLKAWQILGARSLVKLRANSAFWGSLALFLIFGLGKFYRGPWLGLLASAYMALSPFDLAYSQELRPYAFAVAIAIGALWALEAALKKDDTRLFALTAFLWTCLLYTHYWGSFVVGAQALYTLTRLPADAWKKRVWVLAVPCLLFAFWIPVIWVQIHMVNTVSFWISSFSFGALVKSFIAFTGIYFNMASRAFVLPLVLGLAIPIAACFIFPFLLGAQRAPAAPKFWLAAILVPWLLSAWKPPLFVWYRYPFHMFPAFALILAVGLLEIRPAAFMAGLITVCLGVQAWGTGIYFTRWQKANPKAVVRYVHELRRPNTIVVRPNYFGVLFHFYDQGTTAVIDEDQLADPAHRAALKGRNVILIAFEVPSDPVAAAMLQEFKVVGTPHYFPGYAHLGITVYQLQ